jgi:fido (protein-threonine AMPylation protein)
LNIGVPDYQIDTQLQTLLDDLAYWLEKTDMSVAEQAVRLHHRSVLIHPFENGNGRWARLLANIWLRQQRQPIVVWPDQVIGTESRIRKAYIAAIKAADGGDYATLCALHERFRAGGGVPQE